MNRVTSETDATSYSLVPLLLDSVLYFRINVYISLVFI